MRFRRVCAVVVMAATLVCLGPLTGASATQEEPYDVADFKSELRVVSETKVTVGEDQYTIVRLAEPVGPPALVKQFYGCRFLFLDSAGLPVSDEFTAQAIGLIDTVLRLSKRPYGPGSQESLQRTLALLDQRMAQHRMIQTGDFILQELGHAAATTVKAFFTGGATLVKDLAGFGTDVLQKVFNLRTLMEIEVYMDFELARDFLEKALEASGRDLTDYDAAKAYAVWYEAAYEAFLPALHLLDKLDNIDKTSYENMMDKLNQMMLKEIGGEVLDLSLAEKTALHLLETFPPFAEYTNEVMTYGTSPTVIPGSMGLSHPYDPPLAARYTLALAACLKEAGILPTPTVLSATVEWRGDAPGVLLKWTSVPRATRYEVYREGQLVFTTRTPASMFWDTTVELDSGYTYYVRAVSDVARSDISNLMAVDIPAAAPSPAAPPTGSAADRIQVLLYDSPLFLDGPPILKNGRTLVPLRGIAEALGATVTWNQDTQTVTLSLRGTTVRLTIGETRAFVNDMTAFLAVPAEIINGLTYVPLRFVSESLGVSVGWVPTTRTVLVAGPPSVTGVLPVRGPCEGGIEVLITGSGFEGDVAVRFGATPAASVSVVSPFCLMATAPPGSGTVDVTVTNSMGTSVPAGLAGQFAYEAAAGTVLAIAVGYRTGYALTADGRVWAWGDNSHRQLGTGERTRSDVPVQVVGPTNVKSVGVSREGGFAYTDDGLVWRWGRNQQVEELVDTTPTCIQGWSGYTSIVMEPTSQWFHALRADGVWETDRNGYRGGWDLKEGVRGLAAGYWTTYALKYDGSVWAWGDNSVGQLGDGTTWDKWDTPVMVTGLSGVTAIAVGDHSAYALTSDGTLWGWGLNKGGELGNGTTVNSSTPVRVVGLSGVKAVSAGAGYACALAQDGTVWVWGHGWPTGHSYRDAPCVRPIPVPGLSGVVGIACGSAAAYVLKSDGTVWEWGALDQLRTSPVQVAGLSGIIQVASYCYADFALALRSDGTVWAWGDDLVGQLGGGTCVWRDTPSPVPGLSGVVGIASVSSTVYALKSDGSVWSWGEDVTGSLGRERSSVSSVSEAPGQISELPPVTAIGTVGRAGCGLTPDGQFWAWGPTTCTDLRPNDVSDLGQALSVVGGLLMTYVLRTDGTVWAWGNNGFGQLGDGTTTSTDDPVRVIGLEGVTAVAASGGTGYALKSDGTVWGWGEGNAGLLGTGTWENSSVPVQIMGLNEVKAIGAGYAIRGDGTLWAWGPDSSTWAELAGCSLGQPVQIPGLTNVVAVAGGYAACSDGTVWAVGDGRIIKVADL